MFGLLILIFVVIPFLLWFQSDRLKTRGQFLTDESKDLLTAADNIEAKTAEVKRETDGEHLPVHVVVCREERM